MSRRSGPVADALRSAIVTARRPGAALGRRELLRPVGNGSSPIAAPVPLGTGRVIGSAVSLTLGAIPCDLCFHVHHLPLRASCLQLRASKCALRFGVLTFRLGFRGRGSSSSWAMMFSCFFSRSTLLAAVTIAGFFPASGRSSASGRLWLASASSVLLGGHGWAVQPAVADTEVALFKQVSGCGSEPPFRQDRRCGLPRGSSTDDV